MLSSRWDRGDNKASELPVVSRDWDSVKVLFMTTKFKLVKCSNLDGRWSVIIGTDTEILQYGI